MDPKWHKTDDGWVLTLAGDLPDQKDDLIWGDSYLKVYQRVYEGTVTYRIRIDGRRTSQILEDPKWVAVFFGVSNKARPKVRGKRLWRDKLIVVERFGLKPRTYLVVVR